MEIAKGFENDSFLALDLTDPASANWKLAIEIFRIRFYYRFIEPVDVLIAAEEKAPAKERRYGFTTTAIDCLLIETLACFYAGLPETPRGLNLDTYRDFMINPETILSTYFTADTATYFYQHIRCGILHQSETKGNSLIWSVGPVVRQDGDRIIINRNGLHDVLRREFDHYRKKLEDTGNAALRSNFILKMRHICGE